MNDNDMTASVIKILPHNMVEVSVERQPDCNACVLSSTCGRTMKVKAHNLIGAAVGDSVTVKSKGPFKVEITELLKTGTI